MGLSFHKWGVELTYNWERDITVGIEKIGNYLKIWDVVQQGNICRASILDPALYSTLLVKHNS